MKLTRRDLSQRHTLTVSVTFMCFLTGFVLFYQRSDTNGDFAGIATAIDKLKDHLQDVLVQTSSASGTSKVIKAEREDVKRHRDISLDNYFAARDKCQKWETLNQKHFVAKGGLFEYSSGDGKQVQLNRGHRLSDYLVSERKVTFPLSVCHGSPLDADEGWMFYRVGPFVGRGGYDWHHISLLPLPMPSHAQHITGKFIAPVTGTGEVLGYPPVHVHHAHISHRGLLHWLDSHGDSACAVEWGGHACYLRMLPKGYGQPIDLVNDDIGLEFLLNDVREYPSPEMAFYLEVGLHWTANTTLTPVAPMNFRLNVDYHPFLTKLIPLQRSVVWSTSRWLLDGQIVMDPYEQIPWLHSHRTLADSLFVFAASPEDLGLTWKLLESSTGSAQNGGSPIEPDLVWIPSDLEFDRFKLLMEQHDKLKCWLDSSSDGITLEYVNGSHAGARHAWEQGWKPGWYDRAGQVSCRPWRFRKGDPYTLVAVNREMRKHLYDDGKLPLQHTEFRLFYESFTDAPPVPMEVYGSFGTHGRGGEVPVYFRLGNHLNASMGVNELERIMQAKVIVTFHSTYEKVSGLAASLKRETLSKF